MKRSSLSPRMREIVILVGKQQLSYKAAGRELGGISHHTVRSYARKIQHLVGSDLSPRAALTELYWGHRDQFDKAS